MRTVRVAIVGMGPRGILVLERLLEHAHRIPADVQLEVIGFDPGECGHGTHSPKQPPHLLTNTVASQVTMYAPSSIALDTGGLSFLEWAKSIGYQLRHECYSDVGASSGLSDADHLSRDLLGNYLIWTYRRIVDLLPRKVSLSHHRARVVDIVDHDDELSIIEENGNRCRVDFLFLTTGHGFRKPTAQDIQFAEFAKQQAHRNAKLRYLHSAYPVHVLDSISATATVAVQGFGLTAHDVISSLTLGRGGQYKRTNDGIRYIPSGREPRILLFSRTCLPFAARGINQKGLTGRHPAQFFTPDAVERQREIALGATGAPRIDFEKAVLPLILKEMAYAYRVAQRPQSQVELEKFEPTLQEYAAIEDILWPLKERTFASRSAFKEFFYDLIESDLKEAERGNVSSPLKAATDALRDTRETLRAAVEHGGLTPESHRYFVEEFNAIVNRVSFGPPKQRNYELLALHASGILDVAGGPGAQVTIDMDKALYRVQASYGGEIHWDEADVLIIARLDSYSPLTDNAQLTKNLLQRGLIQPYRNGDYHPGGLDVDFNMHPIGRNGRPHRRIWANGFLVEGPHFYTHALPRPQIVSRQTKDADQCVCELIRQISGAVHVTSNRSTEHSASSQASSIDA